MSFLLVKEEKEKVTIVSRETEAHQRNVDDFFLSRSVLQKGGVE